jgi:tetratricopeptide (TPR) repeat protein
MTESVAYVQAQSGVLAAVLGMASLHLHLLWLDGSTPFGRTVTRVGSVSALLMALASKESAVVFAALMLGYVVLIRSRFDGATILGHTRQLLPHLLALLLVPLLLLSSANPHQGTFGFGVMPFGHHLLTQARVLAYSVLLALWPLHQNLDYDFRISTSVWDQEVWGATAVLVLFTWGAWRTRHRAPLLTLGGLWFFAALAPTNSILPFKDLFAERHLYLSMVGFALAAGWALARARGAMGRHAIAGRWVIPAAAAGYLSTLGLLTVLRSERFADPVALWREATERSPVKARPQLNLALHLLEQGQREEGARHLRRALELGPDLHLVQYNAGVYSERTRDWAGAVDHFQRALDLHPGDLYRRRLASALNRLGVEAYSAKDWVTAEQHFRRAIRTDPRHAGAHFNLAMDLLQIGRGEEARGLLARTLELDPHHAKARALLARDAARERTR